MVKKYPYSDIELLKLASKFKSGIEIHYGKLESSLPDYGPDFRENYNRVYTEVREMKSDENQQERLSKLRKTIENEVKTAVKLFASFRMYIQHAFPHDYRIWNKFSYCDFENAIKDYHKMLGCFNEFHEIVKDRKRELDAVHCPPQLYHDIESVREILHDLIDENDKLEKESDTFIESRLSRMNELYYLMEIVHDSAENVFEDEADIIQKFILPVPRTIGQRV